LRFLIIISNPRMLRHVQGLASAAHEKGHAVTVFFNEESVKLLAEPGAVKGLDAEMLACVTAGQYSGVKDEDLVEGARFTSLAEVVTLMEECDRTLFLG
jgi:sulfur relay (sulfurtransferase) complex TusBCD TusD component (DsrE family)